MDPVTRENRRLRAVVVLLLCVVAAQGVIAGYQKVGSTAERQGAAQRFPGPGSGVVDVSVVNDAVRVTQEGDWRIAQQGDWRVAQQGEWRVGVRGTVTTAPTRLHFLDVGSVYAFQWSQNWIEVATVREVHASGWVRIGRRWVNPANAIGIDPR
jgi:hypothetical protein